MLVDGMKNGFLFWINCTRGESTQGDSGGEKYYSYSYSRENNYNCGMRNLKNLERKNKNVIWKMNLNLS